MFANTFARNLSRVNKALTGQSTRSRKCSSYVYNEGNHPARLPSESTAKNPPFSLKHLRFRAKGKQAGSTGELQAHSTTLLEWKSKPSNVLIVKKHKDERSTEAMKKVSSFLEKDLGMNVLVERSVAKEFPELRCFSPSSAVNVEHEVELVVTLGGDGTLLHVSSLFQKQVPPVLSFSLGSLGFLMPFDISDYQTALTSAVRGGFSIVQRMRLQCHIDSESTNPLAAPLQVLNEVTLHRGAEPHVATFDICMAGQPFTTVSADGIIAATGTGSTAYSLGAGGPMLHPALQAMVLTPISPRSLSFRPAVIPPDVLVTLKLNPSSRASAVASFDGKFPHRLQPGEFVRVERSPFPFLAINRVDESSDWIVHLNKRVKWNNAGHHL